MYKFDVQSIVSIPAAYTCMGHKPNTHRNARTFPQQWQHKYTGMQERLQTTCACKRHTSQYLNIHAWLSVSFGNLFGCWVNVVHCVSSWQVSHQCDRRDWGTFLCKRKISTYVHMLFQSIVNGPLYIFEWTKLHVHVSDGLTRHLFMSAILMSSILSTQFRLDVLNKHLVILMKSQDDDKPRLMNQEYHVSQSGVLWKATVLLGHCCA